MDLAPMLCTPVHLVAVACVLGGAAIAPPRSTGSSIDLRTLERLDESREDTGPLRTSLREQPVDLRQPLGFDQVYRLPNSHGAERLARISGGLAAVFPRSTYITTSKGRLALVPPGTVFYIGALPAEIAPLRPMAEGSDALRTHTHAETAGDSERVERIDSRVRSGTQTVLQQEDTSDLRRPAIMTDEAYRAARVRQLLQTAAASSQPSR